MSLARRMGFESEPRFWYTRQLEAGFCVFVRTPSNEQLVADWLAYCRNPDVLVTKPSTCGKPNLPGYVDHRYDQSVLTNLVAARGIRTVPIRAVAGIVRFNAYAADRAVAP